MKRFILELFRGVFAKLQGICDVLLVLKVFRLIDIGYFSLFIFFVVCLTGEYLFDYFYEKAG